VTQRPQGLGLPAASLQRSGERLAAVDVQRLPGEEGVGKGQQDALRDVLRSAEPLSERRDRRLVGEVDGLAPIPASPSYAAASASWLRPAAMTRPPSSRTARQIARASPLPRPATSTV
jgi:hypothetical protein